MKHYFLILWSLFIFNGFLFCQSDSIIETSEPENITDSNTKAKEISIDLSNPKDIELTLKKIHTFK